MWQFITFVAKCYLGLGVIGAVIVSVLCEMTPVKEEE